MTPDYPPPDSSHLLEAEIVAASAGEDERSSVVAHLLSCDRCWSAVQATRRGRGYAERLREVAPPEVRDRVLAALESPVAAEVRRSPRSRAARRAAAAVAVILVAGVAGAVAHRATSRPASPYATVVARLISMATTPSAPASGRPETPGGPAVTYTLARVDGQAVAVAEAKTTFPMVLHAVPMTPSDSPWLARIGGVTLVCLNSPHPMLLASLMPAEKLMQTAELMDAAASA